MGVGSSDLVRSVTAKRYIQPAILAGKSRFSVAVKDIMQELQERGFPPGNYPQVCTAIKTGKFLRENGLEIEAIDGPPSGLSTTVVVHYRVMNSGALVGREPESASSSAPPAAVNEPEETSQARADRLTEKLRGLLKDELAEYGGAEGFIRWIRSEDDDENGK